MAATKRRTVANWLEDLANSKTSSEEDGWMMSALLHRIGFGEAVCTCGIAYLEGKGTIKNPPRSLQSVARSLLRELGTGKICPQ